jgi:hypothetical protein
MCGIPSVTLLGTRQDWASFELLAGLVVEQMAKFCSAPDWREHIMDKISKIAATGQSALVGGDAVDFWCSFYRWKTHSGGAGIDGWLCAFFPVIVNISDSSVIIGASVDQIYGRDTFGGTRSVSSFPSGCSSAPATCDNGGRAHLLHYQAGQVGVMQDAAGSVSPCWGWAVYSTPSTGEAVRSLAPPYTQVVKLRIKVKYGSMTRTFPLDQTAADVLKVAVDGITSGKGGAPLQLEDPSGNLVPLTTTVVEMARKSGLYLVKNME